MPVSDARSIHGAGQPIGPEELALHRSGDGADLAAPWVDQLDREIPARDAGVTGYAYGQIAADMGVLADSTAGLRRQMRRIEQGMGRGVRSNDDYCVVLLRGAKLTSRIKSPEGRKMLTGATQAPFERSTNLAKKLDGTDIAGNAAVINQCLGRDESRLKVSKRALLKASQRRAFLSTPRRQGPADHLSVAQSRAGRCKARGRAGHHRQAARQASWRDH